MEERSQQRNQVPGQVTSCLAFVLNPIEIETELPFELAHRCYIDKATKLQIEEIKRLLTAVVGTAGIPRFISLYEQKMIQRPNGEGCCFEPLPESEWRYYVVSMPNNNINLHLTANISEVPLELASLHFFTIAQREGDLEGTGWGFRPGVLQNMAQHLPSIQPKKANLAALEEIARLHQELIDVTGGVCGGGGDYPEVFNAIQMYDALSLLPVNSEFIMLGLFAIIEMLITHNPKLEDRGDSISHQLQSKVPLLSRRFDRPLDFSSFFGSSAEKHIWSAMYKYRSAVAHGGVVDFQQKEMRILKDGATAKTFLREVVKALLRHSLKEPQLYRDLRNC